MFCVVQLFSFELSHDHMWLLVECVLIFPVKLS